MIHYFSHFHSNYMSFSSGLWKENITKESIKSKLSFVFFCTLVNQLYLICALKVHTLMRIFQQQRDIKYYILSFFNVMIYIKFRFKTNKFFDPLLAPSLFTCSNIIENFIKQLLEEL